VKTPDIISVGYVVAAILFILGLKALGRPRTAPRGNLLGASGMLIAVLVTLINQSIVSYGALLIGLALGSLIGAVLALRVRMTAMPELVALFNGLGGGASVLVAGASFVESVDLGKSNNQIAIAAALTALIGAVTFSGSLIAFFKLRESLSWSGFTGIQVINVSAAITGVILTVLIVVQPEKQGWLWLLVAVSLLAGITVTIPIGGADMPVIIALLNSLSGLAASATGFVLENSLLIIAGSLVGASGLILTRIMCVAMNRSIFDVMFSPAPVAHLGEDEEIYEGKISSTSAEEIAMLLETAGRVVIVPGYGLAVAQAQHAVRDLVRTLQESEVEVLFGIHPVAGRMPGHMNVLLAEAEISYDLLLDMDQINSMFDQVDITIVLGANDVVNPSALNNPNSPIAGMPILEVDKSNTVVVVKRSLSPGFAKIPNPLFAADNTLMLFEDGKQAVLDIVSAFDG
tara:strand:+ start:70 stop:1446 length:1377 start_codon:yes stop_codon:yes gene_type:complete